MPLGFASALLKRATSLLPVRRRPSSPSVVEEDSQMPTSNISKRHYSTRKTKKNKHEQPKGDALYFDQLPDNANEYILHFLSRQLRLEDTKGVEVFDIQAKTALALLKCGGSLSHVLLNVFNSGRVDIPWHYCVLSTKNSMSIDGRHKEVGNLLRDVPVCLGSELKALSICGPLSASFTRAIKKHCTGLRSLTFRPANFRRFPVVNFCAVIVARGEGLEHLSVEDWGSDERVVSTIAKYCSHVRHLELDSLGLDFSLAPVWKSMGANLERVRFKYLHHHWMLALDSMKRDCPNISCLSFEYWGSHCATFDDVCTSYGPGLLELSLSNAGVRIPALNRIMAACPNASISFHASGGAPQGAATDTAVALGSRSSSWGVITSAPDYCDASFSRVGRSCLNLQSCWVTSDSLHPLSEAAFGGLFVLPKDQLRYLNVSVERSVSCIDAVLAVLADKVSSIETLVYAGPIPSVQLLKLFVLSQSQLRKVSFKGRDSNICRGGRIWQRFLVSWNAILTAFLQHSSLVDIVCSCKGCCSRHCPKKVDKIADMCCSARARAASVSVCGWKYL